MPSHVAAPEADRARTTARERPSSCGGGGVGSYADAERAREHVGGAAGERRERGVRDPARPPAASFSVPSPASTATTSMPDLAPRRARAGRVAALRRLGDVDVVFGRRSDRLDRPACARRDTDDAVGFTTRSTRTAANPTRTIPCARTSADRCAALTDEIVACRACPRLVEWREQVAVEKRARRSVDETYWGRPVPGFGDPQARVLDRRARAGRARRRTAPAGCSPATVRATSLFASLLPHGLRQPAHVGGRPTTGWSCATCTSPPRCGARRPRTSRPPRNATAACPTSCASSTLLERVRVIVVLGGFAYDAIAEVLGRGGVAAADPAAQVHPRGRGGDGAGPRARLLPPVATEHVHRQADRADDRRRVSPGPRAGRRGTLAPMTRGRLLEGVYVPLITPFAADGSVALDAVERLCHEYLDAGGARASSRSGTTGESTALDADEQRAVIDACARASASERGAQLIVGAGTNNTAKTIAAVEALAGTPGARRHADRGAVLRAAVGGRDRRALQGGRRREPGAGGHLQHPGAHGPQPRRRRACSSSRGTPTSPG